MSLADNEYRVWSFMSVAYDAIRFICCFFGQTKILRSNEL